MKYYLNPKLFVGGHTTELLRMLKSLPNINFKQVNYIVANSDKMSSNKIKAFEEEKKSFNYKIKTIPRFKLNIFSINF